MMVLQLTVGCFPDSNKYGISIVKSIDNIEVGEHFSTMAIPFPYNELDNNSVIWESSNPSVCSVTYGVLEGISTGVATITAYDLNKLYSKSFQINVISPILESITPDQIYSVSSIDYGIYIDNTHSTETTNGIINALNFAYVNGYKKIMFPYGIYLITPTQGTINLPTNMTIDFNNSIVNIELSSLTASGYTMFKMDNVQCTKLINANVYGEADSTTLDNSAEKDVSLLIGDCYKSGIESCTFSKSPGFNVTAVTKRMKDGTGDAYFRYYNLETGNIDDSGAIDNSITASHFRTSIFIDVSHLGEYYMLGYNQGYWGYPYLQSRMYSIFFYDVNYQFIEAHRNNLQFYNYPTPQNAYYVKVVIYQDTAPSSGDIDWNGAVAFIRTLGIPRRCFIKNSTFENNFSTGLAMTGGQDWTISGNTFSGNNGRTPGCDIDWEDGWDAMVGDIVKNNIFNSTLGIDVAAGQNLSLFNNTFNNSYIYIWERTQNWRVFNNTFNGKGGNVGQFDIHLGTTGDSYFAENTLTTIRYNTVKADVNSTYDVHVTDNIII